MKLHLARATLAAAVVLTFALLFTAGAGAMSTGNGGWQWQNPLPHGASYEGACFLSANEGWLITDNQILRTHNGGVGLSAQANNNVFFKDITFVGSKCGWAVGAPVDSNHGRVVIYRTTNGGAKWRKVSVNVHGWLNAVKFVNVNVGWAVGGRSSSAGGSGLVLKTVNGGLTWTVQKASPDSELLDVSATGAGRAWAGSAGGRLWRTTNGGALWGKIGPDFNETLQTVFFRDSHVGWAAGWGMVWHTTDGGSDWTIQLGSNNDDYSFSDIAFTDAVNGWVVAQNGSCFHTTDGGAHWTAAAAPSAGWNFVAPVGASTAVIGGGGGNLSRTIDGGGTWTSLPAVAGNFHSSLNAVDFVDANNGWAAGGAAPSGGLPSTTAILHTTDGGQTWTGQSPAVLAPLNDIDFADVANGWAVGAAGAIVHTGNGGATWAPQVSGTSADLSGVCFIDAAQGWAVGTEYHPDLALVPVVRHTADGGAHWTALAAPVPNYCALYGVAFADAQNGWAVGWAAGDENGEPAVIFHTANGGASWTQQLSYIPPVSHSVGTASLSAVTCLDALRAVAVGVADNADTVRPLIYRTIDGGVTWKRASVSGSWQGDAGLNSVSFADSLHGWAVGSGGTVLRTTDGGLTWTKLRSGVSGSLHGVRFVSPTRGWIVGDDAAILSTTTGGLAP